MRRLLPLLAFALLVISCTLGTPPPTATPTTEPSQAPVFIDARTSTATTPTTQPAATATTAPTAVLRPNCVIRTDWFAYIVYPGETLGRIATRSGTTAAVLANANCLANPNLIYAGQVLRVPVLLPVITPTVPGNQNAGIVVPSPYVRIYNGQYEVLPDTNIALVWQITPARTFTRVDFFLTPTGTGTTPTLIGSDTYMADGISINFFVPRGLNGYVTALAYYGSGVVGGTIAGTLIYAGAVVSPPVIVGGTLLDVVPNLGLNNNTYVVQTGQTVTINWAATFPSETLRVEFYLIPPGQTSGTLLGTDYNLGDGAQAVWTVPSGAQGTLRALAIYSGGFDPAASSEYYVVTEAVQ
ncbi:MAG: LysM peptidoglycan-binding domain-containing protein [Chloroflexi bacterium]|nr:LysM peptidoglycan-binding domain-containing protein [Chloroflexota bacterium]